MRTKYPTRLELQDVFEYIDGQLWRKESIGKDGRNLTRKIVKNVNNCPEGYCRVSFKNRQAYYHTIIWVLVNGDIPDGVILDHIDGDKVNNNVNNLRLVTGRQNSQNRNIHRNGKLVGCSYYRREHKWVSQIHVNGKYKRLGYFDSEQEAHEAYTKFLRENCL